MEDKLFTIDEVVKYLKIPKSTIYKLSQKKDLPSLKIGKQLRFRKASLDIWLSQRESGLTAKVSASKSKCILIIDDDRLVLKALVKFLKSQGYNVESAESGQEALRKVQESSFDLVVSDIRMPGMDGVSTIKKIRELQLKFNRRPMPEIIITGFLDTQPQKDAEELGIRDYIYKPFLTTDFIETIRNKLDLADAGQKKTLSN